MLLRQTFLLPLASFHNFIIPNSSPLYCTSLKMLSSFLDHFGTLLALTNPLNGGFRLHFLCNFLIIPTYPSTIVPYLFLLFPLHCPSAVLHAIGRPSPTLSLPLLAIPIADQRSPTPIGMVHRPPWSVAIATCPTSIDSRAPQGGHRARESRTTFLVHRHLVRLYEKLSGMVAMQYSNNGRLAQQD